MKLKFFPAMLVVALAAIACQKPDSASEPKLEVSGLSLTENAVAVEAAGKSLSFSVNSNVSYTVTSDKEWVKADPASIENTDKKDKKTIVNVTVEPNATEVARTATVKIASEGNSALDFTFTISQAAAKYEKSLEVLTTGLEPITEPFAISASEAAVSVMAVSTVSWTASSSASWLAVSPASMTIENYEETPATVKFTIGANTTVEAREATVTFTGEGVDPVSVKVNQAGKIVYTFDIDVIDITHASATITCLPSDPEVYYLLSCESSNYVNRFETGAELAAADMEYFRNEYGDNYADYNFTSFEELFLKGLCQTGNQAWDLNQLNEATDYVAYVFAVDSELNVVSDVFRKEFTTEKLNYEFYGNAVWYDVFTGTFFKIPASSFPCDVYTDSTRPGVFFFDSPYWYNNIAPWFDETPESMKQYTGNYKQVYIEIDCSNPDDVAFPAQELGYSLSSQYGWFAGGAAGSATGTYKDNIITFDGHSLVASMSKYNDGASYYISDNEGEVTFTVAITPGGAPAKPASVSTSAIKAERSRKQPLQKFAPANCVELR
ncbi:MAG: hypothetical protein K2G18_01855 [Bacteroidales bacterium]|nr:hypothetical protein [Bacteroidales bacterium]